MTAVRDTIDQRDRAERNERFYRDRLREIRRLAQAALDDEPAPCGHRTAALTEIERLTGVVRP